MTNNLEVWQGLDFKGYQLGDSIFLTDEGVRKMFHYGGGNWRWFYNKLQDVGQVLKLHPMIEATCDDELGPGWTITFAGKVPPTVPRPDVMISRARQFYWDKQRVGWKYNEPHLPEQPETRDNAARENRKESD